MKTFLACAIFVLAATAASAAAEPCALAQTLLNGTSSSSISGEVRLQSADDTGLANTLSTLRADEASARAELARAVSAGDKNLASIERAVVAGLDRSIVQAKASSIESATALRTVTQTRQFLSSQAVSRGCIASSSGSAARDFAGQWVIKTAVPIFGTPQLIYHNAQLVGSSTGPWAVDETMVATTSNALAGSIGQRDTQCLVSLHPGGGIDYSCPSTRGWNKCALSRQSDGSFAGTCSNGSKIELRRGTYTPQ